MGSRGRSIRLRIYFLVAIPLVAMVGLLAYVAGTTINNAINLDRAPNLINATALPTAHGLYSQGIAAEPRLFLSEAESETDATAVGQGLGLIATTQAREQLSQEDALLAGMLAGQRMTQNDRVAFTQMAAARQADLQYAQYILTPANLAIYDAPLKGSEAAQQS